MDFEAMVRRVRAEFLEMPGLRLTVAQAARLCGIERALCQAVLDALVERIGGGGDEEATAQDTDWSPL